VNFAYARPSKAPAIPSLLLGDITNGATASVVMGAYHYAHCVGEARGARTALSVVAG
jgi:hypothetical protein